MSEGCGWIVSRQSKSKYIGRCYVCRSDITSGTTRDEVWDAMEAHHTDKHPNYGKEA